MYSKLLVSLILSVGFIAGCSPTVVQQPTNGNVGVEPNSPTKIDKPVFDASKSQGLSINFNDSKFDINGKIFDAKSQKVINQDVTLTIEGDNKDKVEQFSYSFKTGDINIKLKEGVNPSDSSPVKVVLVAKSNGYIPSSKSLNITNNNNATFTIDLVNLNSPPEGVTTIEKSGIPTNNGILKSNFTTNLQSNETKANMSLKLVEGTTLKDSSGRPLSGNIKADIAFFDNQNPQVLTTFPGGLDNVNITDQRRDGYFITGGFTSIELTDEKGNKAANFDKPMEINMQIPKNTINPETGKEIKTGDKIGLWSYTSSDGKWKSENEVTIGSPDSNGNFNATYNVSHLSYWNLDWFSSERCNPKLRLSWSGGVPTPVQVESSFIGQYWAYPQTLKDEVNDLYNVPSDRDITFTAKFKGKEVGKVTTRLGTECKDINLSINSASLPQMREIPVYVGLRSKLEFTQSELEEIMTNFNVGNEQKTIVFNHFRENNIQPPYKIDDNLVTSLEAKGVQKVRELKMVLDQVIRPDADMYDYVYDPYSFKTVEVKSGKATLRVFDGETHNLSLYFYYKGNYYYFDKNVDVDNNLKEIILDNYDTNLTISAIRDYLQKSGLSINSLGK